METKGFVKRVVGNEEGEECEDVKDMKLVLIEFSAVSIADPEGNLLGQCQIVW